MARTLSESNTQIRFALGDVEAEITSFEGGRKASSARSRKSLQSISGDAHALRKAITETKEAIPVESFTEVEVVGPTATALLQRRPKQLQKKIE